MGISYVVDIILVTLTTGIEYLHFVNSEDAGVCRSSMRCLSQSGKQGVAKFNLLPGVSDSKAHVPSGTVNLSSLNKSHGW